jgi:hypothetical protein
MMIKINDQFSISPDTHGWQLHEQYIGVDAKTKEPKTMVKTTYPASLRSAARIIIERSTVDCTSAKEVIDTMNNTVEALSIMLKKAVNNVNK